MSRVVHFPTVFGVLVLTGSFLTGCAGLVTSPPEFGDPKSADTAASGPRITTDMLTLAPHTDPWGGAAMRDAEGGALLAAALHADGLLGVWRIDQDRRATRIGGELDTGYHPDSVAVWDENNFVVAAEGIGKVQLWTVDGDQVTKTREIASPFGVRDLMVVDLDLDGNPDLLMGPYGGARLAIFWGDGGFEFTRQQLIPAGASSPWHPAVIDWNDNGLPDVVWGPLDGRAVFLARNLGGRQFETLHLQDVQGFNPRHVAIGDVNRNGRMDLVVAVEGGPALVLLREPGGGHETLQIPPVDIDYVSAAVMDDGTIILGEEGRIILVRAQDERFETFEKRWLPAGSLPSPIELFDLDGDGEQDIIVYNSGRGGVTVHFGPLWENANRF